MSSDDKPVAIFLVALFLGVIGTLAAGWPAIFAASIAISVIAVSKEEKK